MSLRCIIVSCALGAVSAASAQSGYIISVDYHGGLSALTPNHPACTVRIHAAFPSQDYAFAAAWFDAHAQEQGWSNNIIPSELRFRGTNPGTINGPVVEDIVSGQIYPPGGSVITDNPILLWQATFTATNFAPRRVDVSTETFRFDVYLRQGSGRSESRMSGLVEGRALIAITPAPGAILAFAAAGLWIGPRRRFRTRIG